MEYMSRDIQKLVTYSRRTKPKPEIRIFRQLMITSPDITGCERRPELRYEAASIACIGEYKEGRYGQLPKGLSSATHSTRHIYSLRSLRLGSFRRRASQCRPAEDRNFTIRAEPRLYGAAIGGIYSQQTG